LAEDFTNASKHVRPPNIDVRLASEVVDAEGGEVMERLQIRDRTTGHAEWLRVYIAESRKVEYA
jgi:hypothetical protein